MPASPYCAHCGALNQSQAAICFACGHSLTEPAPPAGDARRLIRGRYRVVRQLGVGGFGAVYQAEDTSLGNRLVAIKEMSPRGLKSEEAREATEAFQREALLLAGLAHPNLPRIYERFEQEGRWYLVMDFIEGETLDVYLDKKGGRLPVKEALYLARQLTEVLGYLHSRQPPIIFRDLKPSNVIRTPEGQLVLVDFGIARLFKPGQSKDTMAFGSPGYAAPEQYGKAQTTPRSDVFSLGVLLHQMLTGLDPSDKPFRFAPLTMPRPAGLSALIERMVEMDESKRPPSIEVVRRELISLLDERTPWREDDLALAGVSSSPARVSTGAQLATGPVAQAANYTAPPVQRWPGNAAAQPAAKTKKKRGRWLVLVVVGIVLFFNVVNHHSSQSSYTSDTSAPPLANAVAVHTVAWSPDGRYIASAGEDGKIQLWVVGTNRPGATIDTKSTTTDELAWSPDNKYLASLDNGVLDLWVVSDTGYLYQNAYEPAAGLAAFAWSPRSDQIAMAFTNGFVRVLNVASKGTDLLIDAGPNLSANVIAWSPDGKHLATGGNGHDVNVWDSATGQMVYTNQGYIGEITALTWSPDSQRIAAADTAGTVHVWDALTGDNGFLYPGNASIVHTVVWSPDGNYIASGDQQGSVQVWSPAKASPLYITKSRGFSVRAVAWSPDSKRVASASTEGTVQIWDALSGDNVVSYKQP